jgi:hypothetical protein
MIRPWSMGLSFLLSLIFAVTAAAQQLQPKPGFTEKRERVLCGRLGCEAKTFYARPGCRRMWVGGFPGAPNNFKVVCGENP